MDVHILKIESQYFSLVSLDWKRAEIRKADRDFKVDDILILREINDEGEFTTRLVARKITNILKGGKYGLHPDYCMLSICPLFQKLNNQINEY